MLFVRYLNSIPASVIKKAPEEPEDSDSKELPPTEPVQNEEEKSYTKKKLDQLFWLRIALAVIAGILATFIFEPIEGEDRRWGSIAFIIIVFIFSLVIEKEMNLKLPTEMINTIIKKAIEPHLLSS